MAGVEFSQEIADIICDAIATSDMSLAKICQADGMPDRRNVYRWLVKYPEFKAAFHMAQEFRSVIMAEEIIDIADDSSTDMVEKTDRFGKKYMAVDVENINRSRLRVDTRKWAMAHMWPKKYGDKLAVGGDPNAAPIRHAIEMIIVDPADPATDTGSEEAKTAT